MSVAKPPICPRCGADDFTDIRIEQPFGPVLLEEGWWCNSCRLVFSGEAWYDYADGAAGMKEEWTMAESGE